MTQSCYEGIYYTIIPVDYKDTLFVYTDTLIPASFYKDSKNIVYRFDTNTKLHEYKIFEDNLTIFKYQYKRSKRPDKLADTLQWYMSISILKIIDHNGQIHIYNTKKDIINLFESSQDRQGTVRRREF